MPILTVFLFLAAVWDLKKKKIPNLLIAGGFLIGLGRMPGIGNAASIFDYLPGILLPVLICFPLFLTGTLGAGDIKLFSLMGCYLLPEDVLNCMWISFLVAGIASLYRLLRKRCFGQRMQYAGAYLLSCLISGSLKSYYPEGREGERLKEDNSISFGLPIFIAALFVIGGK
ncbi:MAG: prepilin peptidase [Lachnospiraceae bacterium]